MLRNRIKISIMLVTLALPAAGLANCPDWLNHSMKRLHSSKTVNLCEQFAGKPIVIVNTASHCGFTPQFTALEAMYQKYSDKGVG
ncbi:MAG: hypothetical protein WBM41_05270, partial [Arenicellales bacterium]